MKTVSSMKMLAALRIGEGGPHSVIRDRIVG